MTPSDAHLLVDHLFRDRAGQMVAWLTRVFGPAHLELAEEVVQDALVKALQQWPFSGVPDNPAGWLFRVARNGALDVLRRDASFRGRSSEIAAELLRSAEHLTRDDGGLSDVLRDDELRMVFLCCHPAIAPDARVALSLKTVGGFSVREIARAFLAAETTIAQRLVRAKRQLRDTQATFDLPSGGHLAERLDSVLEVVYLLFNEGYAAHDGNDLIRIDLCREALRLARIVADSPVTGVPAAHALTALIALQAARLPARVDASGEMVLLEDQDRALWDPRLIALGFSHLGRSAEGNEMTTYHVQAAIAAVHAGAADPDATRWDVILRLYDDLMAINPSPLVALNRAVALSRVEGPAPALAAIAPLASEPALRHYYLLPSVTGRLLAEMGDTAGAAHAFRAALECPCSEPERRLIQRSLARLESAAPTSPSPAVRKSTSNTSDPSRFA
jgi:RNA polymerase sigma-70 factor (ECF subfamily)